MDRQTLIAHVRSMLEVSTLTRTLYDLPGVERVEFQGFEPGAVQFAVDYEDAVPFDYRLRDHSRDWRVLTRPDAIELWVARTDAAGAASPN